MRVLQSASRSVAALALLALAAGCGGGESNAPDAPFDPQGTSADVAAINQSFDAPAMAAYASASTQISAAIGGAAAAAVRAVPSAALASSGKTGALRHAVSLVRPTGTAGLRPSFATAAIPAEYLGTTFVYDVETDGYVASDLSGAPSNGTRFLLYAVNQVTQVPIEPLVEIGHADITASETATSATVRIIVVSGNVTYLDYAVGVAGGTSSFTSTISGFATNGDDRVDFNLRSTWTGNEVDGLDLALDYVMVVPTRGAFRMEIGAAMEDVFGDNPAASVDLLARGDHGTVTIEGTQVNDIGNYEIEVNGDLFATISVTGDTEPVILGADGQPLSQAEQAAMLAIWFIFAEGFDFYEDLIDPVT